MILLGDPVTWPMALAIVIATAGVVLMSVKPGAKLKCFGGLRPTLLGLGAGALFGLSAIGYRGAILSLNDPSFVMAATFTLAVGLALQSVLLTLYLYVRDRAVLVAIFKAWRPSLFAGFMGALASQFWYLGFAIATAASVRTLALVEVCSRRRSRASCSSSRPRRAKRRHRADRDRVVLLLWPIDERKPEKSDVEFLRSDAVLPSHLPFADGVRVGNLVILSGQIGVTPGTLQLVPGGIDAETRQTFENIRLTLAAHG